MSPSRYLEVEDFGIDTHQEPLVYLRQDSHICRAEGFDASSRVLVCTAEQQLLATLNIVDNRKLKRNHIGLSSIALKRLQVSSGDRVSVVHAPVVDSLGAVRKKIHGGELSRDELRSIIADISAHKYSDIEIASFLSVCAGNRLNLEEIIGLTQAMVSCGERLSWAGSERVFDKHCIGGLPGNRTTPLVVAIVSAAGLTIPKTSSRAITSPAGTADTMGTLTCVNLQLQDIQSVVAETGACLAWGGAVNLSPADDVLIRIERALDLDGEGQLIASVLSKKIAAGSTHALIDIPVGETAKVRTRADAEHLAQLFTQVGEACGIDVRCVITDGAQPVGAGIGPVEEARDLLDVLQCAEHAPEDLREKSLQLSAQLLDMAESVGMEAAYQKARELLDSGCAWQKFKDIVDAQGGLQVLPKPKHFEVVGVETSGNIAAIDNRKLARLAKLAGAPKDVTAGLRLHANVGDHVVVGDPLFTLYSDSVGERDYALAYYRDNSDMFAIEETLVKP